MPPSIGRAPPVDGEASGVPESRPFVASEDGMCSEGRLLGYEDPTPAEDDQTSNWLVVRVEVRGRRDRWVMFFEEPCLPTCEVEELIAFLRNAAAPAGPVAKRRGRDRRAWRRRPRPGRFNPMPAVVGQVPQRPNS